MHVDEANLKNLTGLWKKYGSRIVYAGNRAMLHANTQWPHRCWLEASPGESLKIEMGKFVDADCLEKIPDAAVLPLWLPFSSTESSTTISEGSQFESQLLERKWHCVFQQTAMFLKLDDAASYSPSTRAGFDVKSVSTHECIKNWIEISSEAFAYTIDHSAINNVVKDKNIRILLGWQGGLPAATALLYKTGDIIGVHQVGVKQSFQGQGIARFFMEYIIKVCVEWQAKFIVLQASQSGKPLYDRLGFDAQFSIKNYKRI